MSTWTTKGYGVEVALDDDGTLHAKGTNKATHRALLGAAEINPDDYDDPNASRLERLQDAGRAVKDSVAIADELTLTPSQVEKVDFRTANMLVNGNIKLHAGGRVYQLHFRKKHNTAFTELRDRLRAAGYPA